MANIPMEGDRICKVNYVNLDQQALEALSSVGDPQGRHNSEKGGARSW